MTLCFMPLAQATEYYVARTGNDTKNNGESADTPFATMDKALKVIQPGDAINLLGKYVLAKEIALTAPASSAYITLRGGPLMSQGKTEASEVRCENLPHCIKISRSNVQVVDMRLVGSRESAIYSNGHSYLRILNNQIDDAQRYGVHFEGKTADVAEGQGIVVQKNRVRNGGNTAIYVLFQAQLSIHGNEVTGVREGDGIVAVQARGATIKENTVRGLVKRQSSGIKLRTSKDVVIERNTVSDSAGAGIQVRRMDEASDGWLPNRSSNIRIVGNTISNTVTANSNQPPQCDGSGWPGAIVVSRTDGFQMSGNLVFRNWGEGLTFNSSTGGRIEQNVMYDNYGVNVYLNNSSDSVVRRNYLSYSDGSEGVPYYRCAAPPGGVTLANEVSTQAYDADNFRPLRNLNVDNNIIRGGRGGINYYYSAAMSQPPNPHPLYFPGGLQNVRIYNNTVYGSLQNAILAISHSPYGGPGTPGNSGGGPGHSDNHINANIFYQPTDSYLLRSLDGRDAEAFLFRANLWRGGNPGTPAETPPGDINYPLTAALFVAPGLDKADSYRILPASGARDAASYTFEDNRLWPTMDYFGARRMWGQVWDIGAHEYLPQP
ncbi:right-handed parallel beta-helix repeat-containing protein [Chitinimonas arctica]|uniref:right-handed parallel beta-helix repeat-containing protein n=1 Tax=Chitinimonas arctica TaxID=2594795 RepID=UPI0015D13B00|nr:right-handed parallel beta-helix repeat-containing protein [Chitinimonas arctica]